MVSTPSRRRHSSTISAPVRVLGVVISIPPVLAPLVEGMVGVISVVIPCTCGRSAVQVLDVFPRVLVGEDLVEALVGGRLGVPVDLLEDAVDDALLGRVAQVEEASLDLKLLLPGLSRLLLLVVACLLGFGRFGHGFPPGRCGPGKTKKSRPQSGTRLTRNPAVPPALLAKS